MPTEKVRDSENKSEEISLKKENWERSCVRKMGGGGVGGGYDTLICMRMKKQALAIWTKNLTGVVLSLATSQRIGKALIT